MGPIPHKRLRKFIESTEAALDKRDEAIRMEGNFGGKNPYKVGSYNWVLWIEGYTRVYFWRRTVVGSGFNMTPAEELLSFCRFMERTRVPLADQAEALRVFRMGYTPEALGTVQ